MSNIPIERLEAGAYCHTKMHVDEFDYYWRIDNFLFCCIQLRQRPPVQSDIFSVGPGKWRLSHDPKKSTANTLYFTLEYLGQRTDEMKTDDSPGTFAFIAKLALISSDGTEFMEMTQKVEHRPVSSQAFSTIFTLQRADISLLSEMEKGTINLLTSDGQLTIFCRIKVTSDMSNETLVFGGATKPDSVFQDGISSLMKSGLHSDVVISAAEGREFSVHKCILASISPVFQAMFDHPLTESKTDRVEINVDANVLKEMLRYIYSGQVHTVPSQMAEDIMILADKYALDGLKIHCEKLLSSVINAENACDMFVLADTHNAEHLKSFAARYIHVNAKAIRDSKAGQKYIDQNNHLVLKALAGISFRGEKI